MNSSNNPEISDSLAFEIKFDKLAELNRVSRQVERDILIYSKSDLTHPRDKVILYVFRKKLQFGSHLM